MNQIKQKLDYYRQTHKLFKPERAFNFLENLTLELRKIESKSDYFVYDYFKDEYFSVDSTKAQDVYDSCYCGYYYNYLEEKNVWFVKMKSLLEENVEDYENVYIYIVGAMYFVLRASYPKKGFDFNDIVNVLSTLAQDIFKHEKLVEIIELLVAQKFFIITNKSLLSKQLELSDDTVRLDLVYISRFPLLVIPKNNPTKFSCFYALSTLPSVLHKFYFTENKNNLSLMLDFYKAAGNENCFNLLKNFNDNFSSLDYYEIQKNADKTLENYILLSIIYINRLLMHEYFFQIIILSCFENYYVEDCRLRPNILYERRSDLIYRLYPW